MPTQVKMDEKLYPVLQMLVNIVKSFQIVNESIKNDARLTFSFQVYFLQKSDIMKHTAAPDATKKSMEMRHPLE